MDRFILWELFACCRSRRCAKETIACYPGWRSDVRGGRYQFILQ